MALRIDMKKDDLIDCLNASIKINERAANNAPNELIKQGYRDIANTLRSAIGTITDIK